MERVNKRLAEEVSEVFEKRLPAVLARRKSRNQNIRKLLREVAGNYNILMTETREDRFLEHLARLRKFANTTKTSLPSVLPSAKRPIYDYIFHGLEIRMSSEEKVARAFMSNE